MGRKWKMPDWLRVIVWVALIFFTITFSLACAMGHPIAAANSIIICAVCFIALWGDPKPPVR